MSQAAASWTRVRVLGWCGRQSLSTFQLTLENRRCVDFWVPLCSVWLLMVSLTCPGMLGAPLGPIEAVFHFNCIETVALNWEDFGLYGAFGNL